MVSLNSDQIDFDEIEKQGLKAIDRDARYWRENDAKFRAVNQKVATYEEFRDIVLASHLKPLDKDEKIVFGQMGKPKSNCWNALVKQGGDDRATISQASISGDEEIGGEFFVLPKSPGEFCSYWKKLPSVDVRLKFLSCFPTEAIGELFQTEIPAGMLVEIVSVLNSSYSSSSDDNRSNISLMALDILQQLSRSARFALIMMFLSDNEKAAVKTLFDNVACSVLESDNDLQNVIKTLKSRYSVE